MSFLDKLRGGINKVSGTLDRLMKTQATRVVVAATLGAGTAAVSRPAEASPFQAPTISANNSATDKEVFLGVGYETSGLQTVKLGGHLSSPISVKTPEPLVAQSIAQRTTPPKPNAKVAPVGNKQNITSTTLAELTQASASSTPTAPTTQEENELFAQWGDPNEDLLDLTEDAVLEEGVNVAPRPDQEEKPNNTEALAARVESNSTFSPLADVDMEDLFSAPPNSAVDGSNVVVPNANWDVADQYNLFLAGLAGAGVIAAGAAALRRRRQEGELEVSGQENGNKDTDNNQTSADVNWDELFMPPTLQVPVANSPLIIPSFERTREEKATAQQEAVNREIINSELWEEGDKMFEEIAMEIIADNHRKENEESARMWAQARREAEIKALDDEFNAELHRIIEESDEERKVQTIHEDIVIDEWIKHEEEMLYSLLEMIERKRRIIERLGGVVNTHANLNTIEAATAEKKRLDKLIISLTDESVGRSSIGTQTNGNVIDINEWLQQKGQDEVVNG